MSAEVNWIEREEKGAETDPSRVLGLAVYAHLVHMGKDQGEVSGERRRERGNTMTLVERTHLVGFLVTEYVKDSITFLTRSGHPRCSIRVLEEVVERERERILIIFPFNHPTIYPQPYLVEWHN